MGVSLARRALKPEYVFRPLQVVRRLLRPRWRAPDAAVVMLPWGHAMRIAPRETIGGGIWRLGVHELVVSEVLWRLIDPADCTLDVGANAGYFTALMAARAGSGGTVWSFEPHPAMRARLEANVAAWQGKGAAIRVWDCALSDRDGTAQLLLPPSFELNTGTAHLAASPTQAGAIAVSTRALDGLLAAGVAPAVCKIDVEGHEASVLIGASAHLAAGGLRDIVFEEHRGYPAESTAILERAGFTVFRLGRSLLRPLLLDPATPSESLSWEAPNFLATRDPRRAIARMARAGWACMSAR